MAAAIRRLISDGNGDLRVVMIDTETGEPINNPINYSVLDGSFDLESGLSIGPTTADPKGGKGVIRRLVPDANGDLRVAFVDLDTGEIVSDITDYTKVEQGLDWDGSFNPNERADREAAENEKEETEEALLRLESEGLTGLENMKPVDRKSVNNFGYINKPDWFSYLGMVPGPIGSAAKMAGAAMNINNVQAVNSARKSIGLPELSIKDTIKGIAFDNKGFVGDISINGQEYGVSLEAMTPDGRTALTPAEANRRSQMASGFSLGREGTNLGTGGGSPVPNMSSSAPKGMAALAPNGLTGHPRFNMGPARSAKPSDEVLNPVRSAVKDVLGPQWDVNITSGTYLPEQRNPETGEPLNQLGSTRHNHGQAMDFAIENIETGERLNWDQHPAQMRDIAQAFAATPGAGGIGFGAGYMGKETFHMDMTERANTWGGMPSSMQSQISQGRQGMGPLPNSYNSQGIPTPEPNPGFVPNPSSTDLIANEDRPVRTAEERQAIAYTVAGELSPESLMALSRGEEYARQELANITATIENRMASGRYNNINEVLSPSQYNSLMQDNLEVTSGNYQRFGNDILAAVDEVYSGNLAPTNPSATSYYNPSIVSPNWGRAMRNQTDDGEHRFGFLPEYTPRQLTAIPNAPVDSRPSSDGRPDGGNGMGGDSPAGGIGFGGGVTDRSSSSSGGSDATAGGVSSGEGGRTSDRSSRSDNGMDVGIGPIGVENADGSWNDGLSGGMSRSEYEGATFGPSAGGSFGTGSFGSAIGAGGTFENAGTLDPNGVEYGGRSAGTRSSGTLGRDPGLFSGVSMGASGSFSGRGLGNYSSGSNVGGFVNGAPVDRGFIDSLPGPAVDLPSVGRTFETTTTHSKTSGYATGGFNQDNNRGGLAGEHSRGGAGGGGAAKVICGYFYGKGLIPKRIYLGDLKYSKEFMGDTAKKGYLLWAEPLVSYFEKHPNSIIERMVFPFAYRWAHHMAYKAGYSEVPYLSGKIISGIGKPICWVLGKLFK